MLVSGNTQIDKSWISTEKSSCRWLPALVFNIRNHSCCCHGRNLEFDFLKIMYISISTSLLSLWVISWAFFHFYEFRGFWRGCCISKWKIQKTFRLDCALLSKSLQTTLDRPSGRKIWRFLQLMSVKPMHTAHVGNTVSDRYIPTFFVEKTDNLKKITGFSEKSVKWNRFHSEK